MSQNPQRRKLENMLATNDLVGAEKFCRNVLKKNRYDVDMTALLGAIQLQTGRLEPAERNLKRAIGLEPRFAKPHHDLGVLYMRRREFAQAADMFRKALERDRNLKQSWMAYLDALRELGMNSEIKDICGRLLEHNPDDLEVMRAMAIAQLQEGDVAAAGKKFRLIADRSPDSVRALVDLARFQSGQHRYADVMVLLRRVVKLQPGDARLHFLLADNLFTTGFPAEALEAYEAGLALAPDFPPARSGRAHALRALGRTDEAVGEYRDCIAKGINPGESWWSLASTRTYQFTDADIAAMQKLLGTADEQDRLFTDFALGKAMDDRADYDAAWKHYKAGNRRRRDQLNYKADRFRAQVDAVIERTGPEWFAGPDGLAETAATPIFILGMPRSGTTLVEQILAAHSRVEATTELPYMTALGEQLFLGRPGPGGTRSEFDPRAIGEEYMAAAGYNRRLGRDFFIDKMPDNFLFAGLIAMALPGAKIIDVRRNPMDTRIGNWRQWFGRGKEYAYDLDELADRFLQYHRVMKHWDEVMPGRVLRLDYEALVADPESGIRGVLDHCGLDWEDACLDFHQVDRPVTTASSEQVRQPIYGSAVGFWKHYGKHLDRLADKLEPVRD